MTYCILLHRSAAAMAAFFLFQLLRVGLEGCKRAMEKASSYIGFTILALYNSVRTSTRCRNCVGGGVFALRGVHEGRSKRTECATQSAVSAQTPILLLEDSCRKEFGLELLGICKGEDGSKPGLGEFNSLCHAALESRTAPFTQGCNDGAPGDCSHAGTQLSGSAGCGQITRRRASRGAGRWR